MKYIVWDDTHNSGKYMVWDAEATYIDSMGHTNKGDFVRDMVGKAFLYNADAAQYVADQFNLHEPVSVTTTGYQR